MENSQLHLSQWRIFGVIICGQAETKKVEHLLLHIIISADHVPKWDDEQPNDEPHYLKCDNKEINSTMNYDKNAKTETYSQWTINNGEEELELFLRGVSRVHNHASSYRPKISHPEMNTARFSSRFYISIVTRTWKLMETKNEEISRFINVQVIQIRSDI